jgi:hypothetical protein
VDYTDISDHSSDPEVVKWDLPGWFDDAEINQYLWVDEGTTLDYAVGSGSWRAEGFDSGKHLFSSANDGYKKIKGLGDDEPWSFKDQCGSIDNYRMEDHSGLC